MTKAEENISSGLGIGCLVAIIIFFISMCSGSSEDTTPKADVITETVESSDPIESQKDAEDKRKGFHCLSGWDGSHRGFVDQVKSSLREPDSFEHIETSITPASDKGVHVISMKYRAKNGFGGMNVETAIGTVEQSDCSASLALGGS